MWQRNALVVIGAVSLYKSFPDMVSNYKNGNNLEMLFNTISAILYCTLILATLLEYSRLLILIKSSMEAIALFVALSSVAVLAIIILDTCFSTTKGSQKLETSVVRPIFVFITYSLFNNLWLILQSLIIQLYVSEIQRTFEPETDKHDEN